MKHHKYIAIGLFLFLIAIPFIGYAKSFGLKLPVGGRVINTKPTAAIVCTAASGPIFMTVFNIAMPGPFFIRTSTKTLPKSNGYLIGNYSVTPDLGTCVNPETGAPVPAFELKQYGASK